MALKNLMGMGDNSGADAGGATPNPAAPITRTVAPSTSIDADTHLSGKIRCKETIRIDGQVKGEVRCDKTVIVGEGAKVEAAIQADSILISGEVKGNIVAKRKITLNRTARLTGDLSTPGIVIEEGAKLEGQIVIGGETPAAEKKQATARQAPAKHESTPASPPARSPGVTLPAS
jgi:cytoskeletal protein CcmA (bactofilin family)